MKFWLRAFSRIIAGLILLSTGCAGTQPLMYIDLSRREPLPPAAPQAAPLRLAVAAIFSPQSTAESYHNLAAYLGQKLGRPVQLIQRRTYAEVNNLIAKNEVDLAFVCTSAYVDGHDRFGLELLVAPEINGQTVYYSQLIVPAHSPAQSMADLRGRVFVFTDPMSYSGRVYPTYLLQQLGSPILGYTPQAFFSRTFFTYSHDKAIQAVADGVADGAAVDSLVLQYAIEREPGLRERVRVIHQSPAFGIPPVVVPPSLPPQQKEELRRLLLNMHTDPLGGRILSDLGIDRFVLVEDTVYESARQVVRATCCLDEDQKR